MIQTEAVAPKLPPEGFYLCSLEHIALRRLQDGRGYISIRLKSSDLSSPLWLNLLFPLKYQSIPLQKQLNLPFIAFKDDGEAVLKLLNWAQTQNKMLCTEARHKRQKDAIFVECRPARLLFKEALLEEGVTFKNLVELDP